MMRYKYSLDFLVPSKILLFEENAIEEKKARDIIPRLLAL